LLFRSRYRPSSGMNVIETIRELTSEQVSTTGRL
jgi:hypothetical protein